MSGLSLLRKEDLRLRKCNAAAHNVAVSHLIFVDAGLQRIIIDRLPFVCTGALMTSDSVWPPDALQSRLPARGFKLLK